jgi:hypothetical protein
MRIGIIRLRIWIIGGAEDDSKLPSGSRIPWLSAERIRGNLAEETGWEQIVSCYLKLQLHETTAYCFDSRHDEANSKQLHLCTCNKCKNFAFDLSEIKKSVSREM